MSGREKVMSEVFDPHNVQTCRASFNGDEVEAVDEMDYRTLLLLYDDALLAYREVERELRLLKGLAALLPNGMPPTGSDAFDTVLATFPIAEMIQRGWLRGVIGFDDLPLLEKSICHFFQMQTIEECVNPKFLAGKL